MKVDSVAIVDPAKIARTDARRAGYQTVASLLEAVSAEESMPLYRVEFHLLTEPDPREMLAATAEVTTDDRADLAAAPTERDSVVIG